MYLAGINHQQIIWHWLMTELSPATQAVLDAFRSSYTGQGCLAAALRAVADQVVPESQPNATYQYCCHYTQIKTEEFIRRYLLTLATELET